MPPAADSARIRRLHAAVERLYRHTDTAPDKIIYAEFDRALFSDDFRPFAFYQREIRRTLSQLERLPAEQTEEWEFLTDKLLSQCTALAEALNRSGARKAAKSAVGFSKILSRSAQAKHEVHKLPPRERLIKYYEALEALNDKINRQEISLRKATEPEEKIARREQLEITHQRKKRCLEAIELLEEYLAFAAEQKM